MNDIAIWRCEYTSCYNVNFFDGNAPHPLYKVPLYQFLYEELVDQLIYLELFNKELAQ